MKIALLDDCFLTKDHHMRLKKLGSLTIYQSTRSEKDVIKRLQGIGIAIVDAFLASYNKKVLESTKSLKLLALSSTGYDVVDLETATKRGIKVANVPGFSKESVAEMAIGLMFAIVRNIPLGDKKFRSHPVDDLDSATEEGKNFIGFDVKGKTFGIVGLGTIGTEAAKLAQGLGMHVIAYNRSQKKMEGVKMVGLQDLLKESDVVSIHLPLTKETTYIIGAKELALMKPTSVLLNLGRARNVHTDALYTMLKNGKLKGAALDVVEIKDLNHPILQLKNVVFTPHIASYTRESFHKNLPDMIVENVEAFIKGKPIHIVN